MKNDLNRKWKYVIVIIIILLILIFIYQLQIYNLRMANVNSEVLGVSDLASDLGVGQEYENAGAIYRGIVKLSEMLSDFNRMIMDIYNNLKGN